MNELVYLKKDEPMTDSLKVADAFGKRHKNVMQSLERIIKGSAEKWAECFKVSSYKDESGKRNKMYLMNEKGFSILVMGFTGKKALEWKWKYADAFERMRKIVSEKSTQDWIETRQQGKLTRKAETDTIQKLVEYAKEQGSNHPDKLYIVYSKLANKFAGIEKRDMASVVQLNNLSLMEHIILHVIDTGILMGKYYKEIYKDCKARLETISDLAYLEATA